MTSDTAWVEKAREMRELGAAYQLIARRLGTSEYTVRCALIPGERDRRNEREAKRRLQERGGASTMGAVVREPRPISVPEISILSAPIDEVKPIRSFAPKTYCRVEHPRVATIREIHRRMIRAGKIASRDIVTEFHS
jgi:hypothetical protein